MGYVAPLFAATLICASVAFYAFRHQRATGAVAFGCLMASLAEWTLVYSFELSAADVATKLSWSKLRYPGTVVAVVAWLVVALEYSGLGRFVTRRNLLVAGIVPALTVVFVFVRPDLIWTGVELDTGSPALVAFHASWFWVHLFFCYVTLLAGTVLIVRRLLQSPGGRARQTASLLIGVIVPWLWNVLHVFDVIRSHVDPTPYALTVSGVVLALGIFRFGLLDIVPVARAAVIEGMADGMLVLDGESRIVDLNPAARVMLGLTARDALGRPAGEALRAWPGLAERLGDAREGQFDVTLGEGALARHCNLRVSPFHHGSQAGRLIVFRDVTEARHVERLRSDLAHTLVHDLRNPLTAVLGTLDLLDGSGSLNSQQASMIRVARGGAQMMVNLVNAIMDVTQLESGSMPVERERVRLNAIVAETLDLHRPLARDRRLTLSSDVAESHPPVWADPRLLSRILHNLVGNSIKFTPEGGAIRVSALADSPSALRVAVSDDGPGISAELRERLFQKFSTGDVKGRGTGLGLAFCRLAVEAHGGRIWVETEPGRGSTFSFTLPRHPED